MPKSLPPADRAMVEQELGETHRATLHTMCRVFGIPPLQWQRNEHMRMLFESLAVKLMIERERANDPRISEMMAREMAARSLGIDPAALKKRFERWPTEAIRAKTSQGPRAA